MSSDQGSGESREKLLAVAVVGALLLHLLGLGLPVLVDDSSLYACISKNLLLSGSWFELTLDGQDWLDKPHFQFWVTALSYLVLGVTSLGYRVPALLFSVVAVAYTLDLGARALGRRGGLVAALVLLTTLHFVLSDIDVRVEPYVTAAVAGSVYHWVRSQERARWLHLALSALWCAVAMMCKGPFAAVPVAGFILGWAWSQRSLGATRLAAWGGLTMLFLLPELVALYLQVDSHPERNFYGQDHVSGIRFFFWDSQVGRFFGTGPITGHGSPVFFIHTAAWALWPWAPLLAISVGRRLVALHRRQTLPHVDVATLAGLALTFLVLSFSQFQLPHYLNVIMPFAALLVARDFTEGAYGTWSARLTAASVVAGLIGMVLVVMVGGLDAPVWALTAFAALGCVAMLAFRRWGLLVSTGAAGLAGAVFLGGLVLPGFVPFQDSQPAEVINAHRQKDQPVYTLNVRSRPVEFLVDGPVINLARADVDVLAHVRDAWVATDQDGVSDLEQRSIPFEIIQRRDFFFFITKPTLAFLDASTRARTLRPRFVLHLRPAVERVARVP